MIKRYSTKIKDGKLVIIKIEIVDKKITQFQLLGDFFLYPEESVFEIEKSTIGHDQSEIRKILPEVIDTEHAILYGFQITDVIALIDSAYADEQNES